jgi:hypothetical protein
MNVTPFRQPVRLGEPAMRGLQLLASLEHLTPVELLEQLIFGLLDVRAELLNELPEGRRAPERASAFVQASPSAMTARRRRPAKVIDLVAWRAARAPTTSRRTPGHTSRTRAH